MKTKIFIPVVLLLTFLVACSKDKAADTNEIGSSSSTGKGGSMASMTINGNYLYKLSNGKDILTYDISSDTNAVLVSKITPNNGAILETIHVAAAKQMLFLGTTTGMLIYNIANPASPQLLSYYRHVRSCDPVIVKGDYAFVTLRGGTTCGGTLNQLEVIDISNPASPQTVTVRTMNSPKGLDYNNNDLLVCDGESGLQWFDITDPTNPSAVKQFTGIDGYDIITQGSRFILIGNTGLFQYNINGTDAELLSQIPIVAE